MPLTIPSSDGKVPPGTKCEHGVYIPDGDDKAHYCSICTDLTSMFVGAPTPEGLENASLDQIYLYYQNNKTRIAEEHLFRSIMAMARKLFASKFQGEYTDIDDTPQVMLDAVAEVILDIAKFNGKAKFSTWVYSALVRNFIDWRRSQDDETFVMLETAHSVMDERGLDLTTKVYYNQILSKLTNDELALFNLKAEGFTEDEIATRLAMGRRAIQYRWEQLEAKIAAMDKGQDAGSFLEGPAVSVSGSGSGAEAGPNSGELHAISVSTS